MVDELAAGGGGHGERERAGLGRGPGALRGAVRVREREGGRVCCGGDVEYAAWVWRERRGMGGVMCSLALYGGLRA